MELFMLRVASLLVISFVYMLFDVFNNRNIPDVLVYATFAYGAALTVLYLNISQIAVSGGIAMVILGLGYLLYRSGQIGAADVVELAVISLIMPIQPIPLIFAGVDQFSLPFILSVLLGTGIVSIVLVPLYYLPRIAIRERKPLLALIDRKGAFKALMLAASYLLFMGFASLQIGTGIVGMLLLGIMLLSSVILVLFERAITDSMVNFVGVRRFEVGDILAFNLMSEKTVARMKKTIGKFDRLVTAEMIRNMKSKHVRTKFPVYKKAVPLALPIFLGTVISLIAGNIILFLLPTV